MFEIQSLLACGLGSLLIKRKPRRRANMVHIHLTCGFVAFGRADMVYSSLTLLPPFLTIRSGHARNFRIPEERPSAADPQNPMRSLVEPHM